MTQSKNLLIKTASWAAASLPPSVKRGLYKIPVLTRFIRKSLNTAVPEGLTEVVIAGGISKELHIVLDLHAEKDYWLGTYEPGLQDAARHFIQPGQIVYDVGANIGYISLIAARLVKASGKVFSFEALPANIARLTQNLGLNNFLAYTQVVHAAVIDKPGEATFLTHVSGAMGKAIGSAGRDETYAQSIKVNGVNLDHFVFGLNNPPPDLIKIDIEGGEGLALAGMARLLKEIRPVMLIELHGEEAARQVWENLKINHYELHAMEKHTPIINSLAELDWKAYVIALPNQTTGFF